MWYQNVIHWTVKDVSTVVDSNATFIVIRYIALDLQLIYIFMQYPSAKCFMNLNEKHNDSEYTHWTCYFSIWNLRSVYIYMVSHGILCSNKYMVDFVCPSEVTQWLWWSAARSKENH